MIKKNFFRLGEELLYETAGTALYAVGIHNFAMAAQLPLTGISGVAYILNYLFGVPMGWAGRHLHSELLHRGMDFITMSIKA